MAQDVSCRPPAFSMFESLPGNSKSAVVILLSLALAYLPSHFAFGQMTQQQQQEQQQREQQQREQQAREEQQRQEQQREQQQREEQQREEQAREQQQREQQAREEQQRQEQQRQEQQREEQQREEQAREQQQREQQAREEQQRQEQQAREEQQRDQREQQLREQQARAQQQRDEQQREEHGRQQQTPGTPVHNPTGSPSVHSQATGAIPAASQVSNDTGRTAPRTQALEPGSRTNTAGSDRKDTVPKSQDSRHPAPALPHGPCDKEPCATPEPKPIPPDLRAKLCKGGPCPVCAPGQAPGKDNSCVPALAKGANAAPKPAGVPQSCPAGQIWNGAQCATVGAQQCLPGQTSVGVACQTACATATGGAQGYIDLLRMARQDKDSACIQDPTGDECRSAETTYDMRINEYRAYLATVPTGCVLPDPISI